MIIGIGIDLIEVERVAEKINRDNGFREKIFSKNEIAFCESQFDKMQNYAARFAAKEAFLKATGLGMTAGHNLFEIEIIRNTKGKPEINLTGNFLALAKKNKWKNIHLSQTHLKSMASAVVVIES